MVSEFQLGLVLLEVWISLLFPHHFLASSLLSFLTSFICQVLSAISRDDDPKKDDKVKTTLAKAMNGLMSRKMKPSWSAAQMLIAKGKDIDGVPSAQFGKYMTETAQVTTVPSKLAASK